MSSAVSELEALNFIVRVSGKKGRKSNTYHITPRAENIRKEGTFPENGFVSETEGHDCPERGDATVRNGGSPKVTPTKVTPIKVREGAPSLAFTALSLTFCRPKLNSPAA